MLLEHDLRVRLKERRNRLYRTGYEDFSNEFGFFMRWIDEQHYIAAILREIVSDPVDYEEWRGARTGHSLSLPTDSERARAKICFEICKAGDPDNLANRISSSSKLDDMNRAFVEAIVDPLVRYIEDRIEEGSAVLADLLRYKRLVEWFDRDRLYAAAKVDTRKSEDVLDRDLRRFLLERGVDFPFSQPASPSGKADIVAGLGSDDPLALEIKLFDPSASKDRAYLRQGVGQAYSYAADYDLPAGYFVVFNLDPTPLVFETPSASGPIPTVTIGARTIFLIPIQTNPETPSASKRGSVRHELDEAFLLADVRE